MIYFYITLFPDVSFQMYAKRFFNYVEQTQKWQKVEKL